MTIRPLGAALALAAALGLAAPAAAKQEIIFGISAATGSLQQQTAAEFARRANERLGDLAEVKLYADSQLGRDQDMMQKIRLGTMHITLPSSTMPEVAAEYALFDLPFLIADRSALDRFDAEIFDAVLVPAAEAKGYRPLAMWENGFRHITNNVRPIVRPEDLAGLKIRTPGSSWRVAMFSEYGANPTPMAFSELFVGLQTGVVDGQENPLTNVTGARLNEVQRYLSMTGHVYTPAYPTVGVQAFSRLDPEIQRIIAETAREMAAWARETGAADDERLRDELAAAGMQVNEADNAAFVAASAPLYDKFAAEVPGGPELIVRVRALGGGS
ncbi:MAG: TRAP transporter substrate-binding protein [Rubrimonas sp.]